MLFYWYLFNQQLEQTSNDSLLRKIYDEMVLPKKDVTLVDGYDTAIRMTQRFEHYVTMVSASSYRTRVKVSVVFKSIL